MPTLNQLKRLVKSMRPLAGKVVAINTELEAAPEKINDSPYEGGWIAIIAAEDGSNIDALLPAEDYKNLVEEISK